VGRCGWSRTRGGHRRATAVRNGAERPACALHGSIPTAYGRLMVEEVIQRELILILARDLTSRLATPAFVVDQKGTLVYFNEAAEPVLGRTYAEAGELGAGEWATDWDPMDADGRPIPLEELPLGIAFREGRPAHRAMRIMGGDGVARDIEVTAFPLCARADLILGAIAVFWEPPTGSGD
jgi:PAS domain-containing protein